MPLLTKTIRLTAAQLAGAHDTFVEILPPPSSGSAIIPVTLAFHYVAGATPYDNASRIQVHPTGFGAFDWFGNSGTIDFNALNDEWLLTIGFGGDSGLIDTAVNVAGYGAVLGLGTAISGGDGTAVATLGYVLV